jgi:hypothetical protein
MDMALELGLPVATLSRTMHEHELRAWQVYAARRLLPSRRMEFYFAQIALLIAKTMGGARNATLADFMLQLPKAPLPDDFDEDAHVEQMIANFQFKPRNKK